MSTKANATLIHTGTALTNNDTVTIGSRVYTYKTTLTGAANEVLIGAATASLSNLKKAVNASAGAGTVYGTGTVAHADVDATTLTGATQLLFEAKVAGTPGNLISKAETSSQLSWDTGGTFAGGTDSAPPETSTFKAKITNVARSDTTLIVEFEMTDEPTTPGWSQKRVIDIHDVETLTGAILKDRITEVALPYKKALRVAASLANQLGTEFTI